MTSWQDILADIDWENDFDPNDSDFETNLGSEAGIHDPNLTISTNEILENVAIYLIYQHLLKLKVPILNLRKKKHYRVSFL